MRQAHHLREPVHTHPPSFLLHSYKGFYIESTGLNPPLRRAGRDFLISLWFWSMMWDCFLLNECLLLEMSRAGLTVGGN